MCPPLDNLGILFHVSRIQICKITDYPPSGTLLAATAKVKKFLELFFLNNNNKKSLGHTELKNHQEAGDI